MDRLFSSFFIGGFECSTYIRRDGRRLDLLESTGHAKHLAADYQRLRGLGIHTAREGLRWHLIERQPGEYDWSSALPMMRTARAMGIQVIWDLFHYGWPDGLDPFSVEFPRRFARFARAFARVYREETGDGMPFIIPINEISWSAWAGGSVGYMFPYGIDRGWDLKRQLVRATIEGIEAVWSVLPEARLVTVDPLINVIAERPEEEQEAEGMRRGQFEAWDMLAGRAHSELGGADKYLGLMGLNYYLHNQFTVHRETVWPGNPRYRPMRELLQKAYARYRHPMFIAETGAENAERAAWIAYVGGEVRAAMRAGVPIHGITLYPIVNYPGWEDERPCENGLWGYPDEKGNREICKSFQAALERERRGFEEMLEPAHAGR